MSSEIFFKGIPSVLLPITVIHMHATVRSLVKGWKFKQGWQADLVRYVYKIAYIKCVNRVHNLQLPLRSRQSSAKGWKP